MDIREISVNVKISATVTKTSHVKNSAASDYSKILAEKISNARADMKAMDAVQQELDFISDMHEELTGTVKIDEDSGNANRKANSAPTMKQVETVKRFLPDGSILLTTYEDGHITERTKLKPHMIVAPDYSAPPKPDGSVATELKPTNNFYQAFLMI